MSELNWSGDSPDIFALRSMRKQDYHLPRAIDEECFPFHGRYMDQLRDIATGRNSTREVMNRIRKVLTNDCTAYFFNYCERQVRQKQRVVASFHGETRLGKSTNAITMNCYGRDWFRDYLGVTPQLVYPQSLAEVPELVKQAEASKSLYLFQQDEDSIIGGPGSRSTTEDYVNCVTNLAYMRYWFLICNPDPPAALRTLCDQLLRVIGYNPKMGRGTTSNMLLYPDGTEQGVVFIEKYRFPNEFGDRDEYAFYDTEIKPKHQHEMSVSGGYVAATSPSTVLQRANRIAQMMLKLKPENEKFSDGLFGSAAIDCNEHVLTKGDQRNHLKLKTEAVFNELIEKRRKEALQTPPELVTQPNPSVTLVKDKRMDKDAASIYSNVGHSFEDSCWDQLLPDLFKGTDAKLTKVTGYGKEDGIIDYKGVTFICDTKNRAVPMERQTGHIHNWKLKGCIDRYRNERQRGNSKVYVTIVYHEENRKGWLVAVVRDPLSIPVDSKGRPKGSQKIDLSLLKPTLTLQDFEL